MRQPRRNAESDACVQHQQCLDVDRRRNLILSARRTCRSAAFRASTLVEAHHLSVPTILLISLSSIPQVSLQWLALESIELPSVAPVFSHNELLIHSDCHRAFERLADATDWPNWLVIVKNVISETPGTTGQGSLYRLRIFNSPIQSRIVEYVLDQRISWIPLEPTRPKSDMAITMPGVSFHKLRIASSSPKSQALGLEIARIQPRVVRFQELVSASERGSVASNNLLSINGWTPEHRKWTITS